jgi:RNA polymerase sigma-70 factor (ECF subfamily)
VNTTSLSLVERLKLGTDQVAWERFVELYTPMLVAWCRRIGLTDADTADLTQTVFVTLYEKLREFRYDPQLSFRAWLKTVLLNAWRNQQRKRRVGRFEEQVGFDPAQIPDTDPRLQLEEAEYRSHLIRRAVAMVEAQFEPSTARAWWEYVVQDRPAQEVADELGLTLNAVYLAKSRVLRHLRTELQWLL